jgi:hypothetical protein
MAAYDAMNELIGFLTENCCGRDRGACLPAAGGICEPDATPLLQRIST